MIFSEASRIRREKIYNDLFTAPELFASGIIAMPAMLFNPALHLRVTQFLFFYFLCWLAGKKYKPLITIIIIFLIVAFNLIVPHGEVLFSIGRLNVTHGALMTGIQRAITLQALIMLSRLSIRKDLKFPGRFGELLGESFKVLAQFTELGKRIRVKSLMADIDELMVELGNKNLPVTEEVLIIKHTSNNKIMSLIIIITFLLLTWLLFFLNYL
ncbi:MAG: hypothetical protein FWG77_11850 [Treponema sp.]|nr:hypothetical protein [Treponema sp.]